MQKKYYFLIVILLVLFDGISKYLVVANFNLGESLILIDGLFNFTYVQNKGIAFSFLADFSYSRYLLPTISLIASIILVYFIFKTKNTLRVLAFALILAGAFGNFIDRAFLGYVIDFIHFYYQDWHFAIFNIADSLITIGVVLFVFSKDD